MTFTPAQRLRALERMIALHVSPVQITDEIAAPDGRIEGGIAVFVGDEILAIGNDLDDALDVITHGIVESETGLRLGQCLHRCQVCMLDGAVYDWTPDRGCENPECAMAATVVS